MKIKITSDSTFDLNKDYIEKEDIHVFPLYIRFGDQEFTDNQTITADEIMRRVSGGEAIPTTAAVSIGDFKEKFEELVDEGYAVIHFDISSEMSSSYSNARLAAEGLKDVYIIDSRTLSSGIGLLVCYACDLREKGYDAATIYEKVLERIPYVQASFVIDKLDYLYKGGRCSMVSYLGANLLSIKPTIQLRNGKMGVGKKRFGSYTHCVERYILETLEEFSNPDNTRVFFTSTTVTDEISELVLKLLKENTNFKEIIVNHAAGTITSHCGPNTLGILYINDGGKED